MNFYITKTINTWHITGYIQDMWSKKFIDKGTITTILGFRTGYYSINNTFMFSPRFSISYTPEWQRLMAFRLSLGLYQQPPFWKEMVGWDGTIYDNVPNQKSFHFVLGMEYSFWLGIDRLNLSLKHIINIFIILYLMLWIILE